MHQYRPGNIQRQMGNEAAVDNLYYIRYPSRLASTEQDPSMIMKLGKKVFSHCPQGVLRVAGNLLYPHVG
jgi:hypothetical protein